MKQIDQIIKGIREKISSLPKKEMNEAEVAFVQHYLGSDRRVLGAKTKDVSAIAGNVLKENSGLKIEDLIQLLNGLFGADNFEEYVVGGKIFTLIKPEVRSKILFDQLERWLSVAKGWVEVDVICQSAYTGKEVLERWSDWETAINKFSRSKIISLRRASLVLQTKPVKEIDDVKLRRLAFLTIDKLKGEKAVLITKAISWLLRNLTVQNKEEIRNYLLMNESTLPCIAFRETMKKIETGRKITKKGD